MNTESLLDHRFCIGCEMWLGADNRRHDDCEDVRVITHRQAVNIVCDGAGILGGVGAVRS
jgi:hypothetical protein